MTADSTIFDILRSPLDPNWTVESLTERVIVAIASQPIGSEEVFVIAVDESTDQQTRRLIRPILACLATKSANESGATVNLYGGHLLFNRTGPAGPVFVVGEFENRPGRVRLTLRRSYSPDPPAESDFGSGVVNSHRLGSQSGVWR
jgi:hypothetical protein